MSHHAHNYEDGCAHPPRIFDQRSRPIRKTWGSTLDLRKADTDNSYQWLHHVADEARNEVIERFLEAVRKVQGSVNDEALGAALKTGNVDEVLRVLALDEHLAAALRPALTAPLEDVFIAAGRAAPTQTLAHIPKALGPRGSLNMKFDISNPRATQFIQQYDFGLIREVTDETRAAIRLVVLDAFENGGHPYEQARQIKGLIGLTQRQTQAVLNYSDALEVEGRSPEVIARMTETYQARVLRARAVNIARTETIRASNAGQDIAWQQAADKGLLDRGTARQQWLITDDDRLCPLCEAVPLLNPDGVPLGGYFQTPVGPVRYGPLHPQCRCTVSLSAL